MLTSNQETSILDSSYLLATLWFSPSVRWGSLDRVQRNQPPCRFTAPLRLSPHGWGRRLVSKRSRSAARWPPGHHGNVRIKAQTTSSDTPTGTALRTEPCVQHQGPPFLSQGCLATCQKRPGRQDSALRGLQKLLRNSLHVSLLPTARKTTTKQKQMWLLQILPFCANRKSEERKVSDVEILTMAEDPVPLETPRCPQTRIQKRSSSLQGSFNVILT